MKKAISFILTIALLFSLGCPATFAANEGISEFSVEISEEKEHGAQLCVDLYEDNGDTYLFIPQSINLADAKVYFSASGDVTADGEKITSGSSAAFLADKTEVTLTCGGTSRKVKILVISDVSSVFIETESGSLESVHADKEHKEKGEITIVGADGNVEYDGELDYIKGRGNSTWGLAKKPYNIKLEDKANLFGMGKSKKWSLLANHSDASLVRNSLAFTAAQNAGIAYTPKYEPVDVYINSEYMGAYLLTTRVEVDKTRVNIDNLEDLNEEANPDADIEALPRGGVYGSVSGYLEGTRKWVEIPNDPKDITGGYILELELPGRYDEEISGFVTENSQTVILKSPEYASENEVVYIASYYQLFEKAVYGKQGVDALGEYCNVASLVDSYIFNEWTANHDAGLTSTYLYKPADDTLYAGPVWDFDKAFGNCDVIRFGLDYNNPSQWTVCHSTLRNNLILGAPELTQTPTFYNLLAKDEDFISLCKQRWNNSLKSVLASATEYIVTDYAAAIEDSAVANAIRWNTYGTKDVVEIKAAFANSVKKAADFADTKAEFISANIGTVAEKGGEEPNAFDAFKKKAYIFINNIIEKAIMALGLENKI